MPARSANCCEETGYVATDGPIWARFHNAIGYSDEKIEVYLARGLSHVGAGTDAGEVLEIFTAPWREVLDWVRDGTVTDVKTIVGPTGSSVSWPATGTARLPESCGRRAVQHARIADSRSAIRSSSCSRPIDIRINPSLTPT